MQYLVWLVVIFAHVGLIVTLLLARPRLSRETRSPVDDLSLLTLPRDPARADTAKIAVQIDGALSRPTIYPDLPSLPMQIGSNAITLSPAEQKQNHIDWDRESGLVVQSSIAKAASEKNYRDLSSLTPEQLDWVRKNHMEPMPGFQWDQHSRNEMLRHGMVKLNDYCVLIVVIPFCRFGGQIQYNGDLFKDMHDSR